MDEITHIIDDSTDVDTLEPPPGFTKGLDLGMRGPNEHEYGDTAQPFPAELLIPESEWQARIQEMEERKTRLSDLINQAGLPCKDQNGTNYCWINAPTHCVEILRVRQNQKMVILSPASAGAQIKGYQNVGGWGKEGLLFIIENGLVPVDHWPANAIDRQYATAANKQLALDFRVVEWWELRPRTLKELMSCLLRRIPIAVGYNWWSHEVTMVDPVWTNGQPGGRIRNSWTMDWPTPGAGGYSVLQGQKLLPDDAVAPRTALAT